MILLDTNVVSEVMRPRPRARVVAWLDDRDAATLFLSTVTLAEIRYGLCCLPDGRRRRDLGDRFERFVARGFERRILSFDAAAARDYGELMAHRRRLGRPLSALDGQIVAIARARGFAVATGNVPVFEECGVEVLDPFA